MGELRFGEHSKTHFSGRNGVGQCIGMRVYKSYELPATAEMPDAKDFAQKAIHIIPIHSKGRDARCRLEIPQEEVGRFCQLLEDELETRELMKSETRRATLTVELRSAAQMVVDNWESGDLAFAVRTLAAALENEKDPDRFADWLRSKGRDVYDESGRITEHADGTPVIEIKEDDPCLVCNKDASECLACAGC